MAERAADRPAYGHFGQAYFDQNENRWHFERDIGRDAGFKVLEGSQVIIPPVVESPTFCCHNDSTEVQSRRLEKQAKGLVQTHPELQPAFDLLPELARVSEAVEEAASHHDPRTGDLLAFGRIRDLQTNELVEVAAFPCSPTGSDLRIVQVQKSIQVWEDSDATPLEVPTISGQDAVWNGPGAPIQAITFAQPTEGEEQLLAVRLCAEIWIFSPVLKKVPYEGSSSLNLNPALRLGVNENGGLPLAHIEFNPWASKQLATIDEAGLWSVKILVSGEAWVAEETTHGDLMDDSGDADRKPVEDGWARMMWVGDQSILAICNRRKLLLFHVGSQGSEELPKVATVLGDSISWNLDLVVVPTLPHYLFVLTTTHILIYHVRWTDIAGLTWKCTLCLRHFRNPADISLRLHGFMDGQDAAFFLRSDSSSAIMIYRFDFSNVHYIVASAPTELAIPMAADTRILKAPVSSLWLHSLTSARTDALKSRISPAGSLNRQLERYYSITTLHKDLAVLQTICFSKSEGKSGDLISPSKNELPLKKQGKMSSGGARSRHVISSLWRDRLRTEQKVESSFGNPHQDGKFRNREAIRQQSFTQHLQQGRAGSTSRSSNEWTVSQEMTVRQLNDMERLEAIEIDAVLNETNDTLQTSVVDDVPPMRTLKELAEDDLVVQNLQEANASLNELLDLQAVNQVEQTPTDGTEPGLSSAGLVLRQIGWTPAPTLNNRDHLSSIHQSIIDNWISPPSDDIPDVVRTARSQRALRMATEVALASLVIRLEDVPQGELPQSQDHDLPFGLALRLSGVPPPSPATPSVYYDASSQPQSPVSQTPSRSTTPSTITSSGQAAAAPEIARLSRYTTFSKPAPPSLPRSLQRVMSHWIPGTDLADYDWQATSHRFARREEEEEGEELTEKEQRRRQQRLERRERRRQRHEEESQRIQIRSIQAPEIMTESQPTQITEGYGADVGTGYSQAAASQILSGRHGGRQPPRKKRKSGF